MLDLSSANGNPSAYARNANNISEKPIIIAFYSTWYSQEEGEKDWKKTINPSFPDGTDNFYNERVVGLPSHRDFSREATRIQ